MALEFPNLINCAGAVDGATGLKTSGRGFVAATTGAGVYTLTLDQPVAADACSILLTRIGAVPVASDVTLTVVHTSDTVKTVHATVAGVATNESFGFAILQFN